VHAALNVRQGKRPSCVGTNEVPLHHVPGRAASRDPDPVLAVGGNDVARADRASADGVIGRISQDAVKPIPQPASAM